MQYILAGFLGLKEGVEQLPTGKTISLYILYFVKFVIFISSFPMSISKYKLQRRMSKRKEEEGVESVVEEGRRESKKRGDMEDRKD